MLALLSVLCLVLQWTTASPLSRSTIASPRSSSEDYLLPTDITPDHYTIELEPDFENDVFSGSVSIEFTVITTTRDFYFHRRELQIDSGSISLQAENEVALIQVFEFNCDETDREFCVITFADELIAGKSYTLTIASFSGILNLDNAGFYLAKYEDDDGKEV